MKALSLEIAMADARHAFRHRMVIAGYSALTEVGGKIDDKAMRRACNAVLGRVASDRPEPTVEDWATAARGLLRASNDGWATIPALEAMVAERDNIASSDRTTKVYPKAEESAANKALLGLGLKPDEFHASADGFNTGGGTFWHNVTVDLNIPIERQLGYTDRLLNAGFDVQIQEYSKRKHAIPAVFLSYPAIDREWATLTTIDMDAPTEPRRTHRTVKVGALAIERSVPVAEPAQDLAAWEAAELAVLARRQAKAVPAVRKWPTGAQMAERSRLINDLNTFKPGITQSGIDAHLAVHGLDGYVKDRWLIYQAEARHQQPLWGIHCVFEVAVQHGDSMLIYRCLYTPDRIGTMDSFEFRGPVSPLTETGFRSEMSRSCDRDTFAHPQAFAISLVESRLAEKPKKSKRSANASPA